MEELPLLRDMVILMGVSVLMSIVLTRVGIPTVVGFFLTGVIIGPYGLGFVTETDTVKTLAEVGIVLLLFTIGLEFSVKRVLSMGREAIIGGILQLAVTIFFVWVAATLWGMPSHVALALGFIISLSSSAIVLKLLVDRMEVHSSHGTVAVGILLFQDISMVLMVMLLQNLGEGGGSIEMFTLAWEMAAAIGIMVAIVVTVAYLAPRLFHEVVKLRNREVFILTVVLVCLGTAWLASLAGLSLAIGAFIAGLVISESEYSNQIVAEILPFRDTFGSLFFVSIGMLVELKYFMGHAGMILPITAGVMLLKALIIAAIGQLLRYPLRLSIITGLHLSQIGEFSFILIKMAEEFNFFGHDLYQTILTVSVMTMALTPVMFATASKVAMWMGYSIGRRSLRATSVARPAVEEHVIIVGYGLNGQNLARVLKETAIEHLVLDINMDRVRRARKEGHRAYFGDSSYPEVLKRMGIERARIIVLAITDPVATRRTLKSARELNPSIRIIVRTRYVNEVEELYSLGADEVIAEEFETSVEIFARVLKEYRVPGNIIQTQIELVRERGYAMLRTPSIYAERLAQLTSILETSVMDTFLVEESSPLRGKTLGELDIRTKTGGAGIIAIIRKGKPHTNPPGSFTLKEGDLLVVVGSHAELTAAMKILGEGG